MAQGQDEPQITLRGLLFDVGLYQQVPLAENDDLRWLSHGEASLDAYCPDCKQESTFKRDSKPEGFNPAIHGSPSATAPTFLQSRSAAGRRCGDYTVRLSCARAGHDMVFHLVADQKFITKIGQAPSMADINKGDLRRFSRVIDDVDAAELARGIGLHAHGIGVGAFVYLRRILERLVRQEEASPVAGPAAGLTFVERIKALKGKLPAFLVDHAFLYSVLSKGIHELSEKDCVDAFPIVREAIEHIFTDRLLAIEQGEQRDRASKALSQLNSKLGAKASEGPAAGRITPKGTPDV